MTYMEWMITDTKKPLPESIQQALAYHEKKYGKVPNIVECSLELELPLPVLEGVVLNRISIPKNILLIGVHSYEENKPT